MSANGEIGRAAALALLVELTAEDIAEVSKVHRYTPTITHLCGCLTRFDTLDWRSEALDRCAFHTAQETALSGGSQEGPEE